MGIKNFTEFIFEGKYNHEYFLPSYEEAREICNAHDNFIFYESKHIVDGYNVSIFNYRLASFDHFNNPIPSKKNLKSFEMRGLTFVFNEDGSLFKRFLLLDKFFNVDQTPCSMYSVIKDFKIKNIFNKEDGSVASFIMLPNGNIKGRSKASFESDQSIEIQNIYDSDKNIQRFVRWSLENDISPIFEYVSPRNRIVLPYVNTKLILLRLRDNSSGEYLNLNDYSDKYDGISVVKSEDGHTLDSIRDAVLKSVDIEGVVVQFENGKMVKIKSPWYIERHSLFTDEINRENTLIKMIVEETIDDVIAQLPENDDKRSEISNIIDIVNSYIKNISDKVDVLVSDYNGSKKDFALKNIKNNLFPVAMGVINGKDKIEMIKSKILSDTRNLMSAREWIKKKRIQKLIKWVI